jgi:hypothetical protein
MRNAESIVIFSSRLKATRPGAKEERKIDWRAKTSSLSPIHAAFVLLCLRRFEPKDFHEQINFLFGSIGASRSTGNSAEVQGGGKKRRTNLFSFLRASLLIFLMASHRGEKKDRKGVQEVDKTSKVFPPSIHHSTSFGTFSRFCLRFQFSQSKMNLISTSSGMASKHRVEEHRKLIHYKEQTEL